MYDFLDGLMLGDGGIAVARDREKNSYFYIEVSGAIHMDWLRSIKKAFLEIGILISPTFPKVYSRSYHGRSYDACRLVTPRIPLFTQERLRWYVEDKGKYRKVVPRDLKLTPVTLAHWFIGDGCTAWCRGSVILTLYTNGFIDSDVAYLNSLLAEKGLPMHINRHHTGYGSILTIAESNTVNKFLRLVEAFIPPSYQYKIKKSRYWDNDESTDKCFA